MDQELTSLRTQLGEQQASLLSLSDSLTRLNTTVSRAASSREDPDLREQVRLKFETHTRRLSGLEWETSGLGLSVNAINENLGDRAGTERRTWGADLQELRDALTRVQDSFDSQREQSKRDSESLKTQIRTLEERAASSRSSPYHGAGDNRVLLTRQKGFPNLMPYNGDGGSAKWKEWRFGIMNWLEQEYPAVASFIREVDKLETEPTEPVNESI